MKPTFSIIILTHKRDDALPLTIARIKEKIGIDGFRLILVDNNTDGEDRRVLLAGFADKVVVVSGDNLGVAEGRNRGMQHARGEFVLFLDDDALLDVSDTFKERIATLFDEDKKLQAIAFRSFVGHERIEQPQEFPHTDKTFRRDEAFETFRFIGVAHAVRRTAFEQTGGYCASFFYGMEEFDLAYQLMKKGGKILYLPEFAVQHMKNANGRLPAKSVLVRMYTNKLAIAWMHLPAPYLIACSAAWFIKTAWDARSLAASFEGMMKFWENKTKNAYRPRKPSFALTRKIQALGGSAWK